MFPGKPCRYLLGQGCGIYERRPNEPCVRFKCGWLQDPIKFPEHMNPTLCGAIVRLDRKWHRKDVIQAIPTGEKIPADTLEWLMAFSREQSLPLLFNEYLSDNGRFMGIKKIGYGPQSFIRMVESTVEPEDIMM